VTVFEDKALADEAVHAVEKAVGLRSEEIGQTEKAQAVEERKEL
jgi:hypothetical protein